MRVCQSDQVRDPKGLVCRKIGTIPCPPDHSAFLPLQSHQSGVSDIISAPSATEPTLVQLWRTKAQGSQAGFGPSEWAKCPTKCLLLQGGCL